MILKILLIVLNLLLGGIYTLMAIEQKNKLLGFCAVCWFVCAFLNLLSLLARC